MIRLFASALLLSGSAFAQSGAPSEQPEGEPPAPAEDSAAPADGDAEKKDEKWDVTAPPMDTRMIDVDVDEGTWMSLDVSPDGRTIAFELLGDIYTMPFAGGAATNIAPGLAHEFHPRFSPDGALIAFTSDRAGGDNIWIMNKDGSDKRQVTKEKFRLMNNPTWA
ncbi:MAG: amidohydrolase, partial [Pseudomonadota bacterium]